jgi:hypothetical protein
MHTKDGPFDIFAAVRALTLPRDQYAVFGSGPMTARGLRDSKDVDLLVTPELFEALKACGWQATVVTIEGRPRERLSHGLCEAYKALWAGGKDHDVAALISRADDIRGVRFVRLSDLLELKRAMGRDKDLRDARIIERYLQQHLVDR